MRYVLKVLPWLLMACCLALTSGAVAAQADGHGDFNGDGHDDLAIGVPDEDVGTKLDAGGVNVIYGSATLTGLTSTGNQFWTQDSSGVLDTAEAADRFGSALATGDFNGDEYTDLAIGVADEDVGAVEDAGAVQVLYGSATGLVSTGNQLWTQNSSGILDSVEVFDRFGASLAAGQLGNSPSDDLAIGTPDEDVGEIINGGAVNVIYGSFPAGLTSSGNQLWTQNSGGILDSVEEIDHFGAALAIGDMGISGEEDLAIGVPDEDVGEISNAGAVNVLYGNEGGLASSGNQFWTQNSGGILDSSEADDRFGAALASGELGRESPGDLAVGVPEEDVGAVADAGGVQVIYGSGGGLTSTGNQHWTQNSGGILDSSETGDQFGYALAIGEWGAPCVPGAAVALASPPDELAVGVPFEDVGEATDAGAVQAIYGSGGGGLTSDCNQLWTQDSAGILDTSETGDRFGSSLTSQHVRSAAESSLAIGVPYEDVGVVEDSGAVQVIHGSTFGLVYSANQLWSQNSGGILDSTEGGDHFGYALGT